MKRLAGVLVLALTSALMMLPAPTQADAVYYRDQSMEIHGTGWSYAGVWSYNSSEWSESNILYGDYRYNYTIVLDDWVGHFLYDFDTGTWTQSFLMTRQNL